MTGVQTCALPISFGSPNAIGHNRIAQLKSDGRLDPAFQPSSGVNGEASLVFASAIQPDGKWIVAGEFDSVEGQARSRVARLNVNGSLDRTFDPGVGPNARVRGLALQPDGKLIMVGEFTSFGGTPRYRVARLNPNGSLDPAFNPGADGPVCSVVLRPNGQILVGGSFAELNGSAHSGIGRLQTDGTVDSHFNPSAPGVRAIAVQADGKILLGGGFPPLYESGPAGVARLSNDGKVDTAFASGQLGADNRVTALAVTADNRIIVGGLFSAFHEIGRAHV